MSEEKMPGAETPDVEKNEETQKDESTLNDALESVKESVSDVVDAVKDVVADTAAAIKEQAPDVVDEVKEKLSDIADKASDVADDAKDKAADVVDDLKEKASAMADKASEMADKATEMAEAAKEKVADVVSDAKEKAADVVSDAKDKVSDMADAAKEKIEDIKNPEPKDEKATAEPAAEAKTAEEPPVDLNTLNLAELSARFDKLSQSEDRMKRYKEAEAIKSAFYRRLSKEKADAGLGAKVDEPSSKEDVIEEVGPQTQEEKENPFSAIEAAFKGVYANYKKERAEYNRQQDELREQNYEKKLAVIEELKALVEKQEDVNTTFPTFRELQNKWREIGPVPASKYMDLNNNYQFYVEKFYDMVKINRDLRDLDFKKNLEAKTKFCEEAEKLAEKENVVEAFHELQKLHEQWKEYGPVAKEYRESIWERFRAATSVINKKYQAYFEAQKEKQVENLAQKTKLCEQVEEIADKEIKTSNEWNQLTAKIEEIQKQWRTIGFATKKENQKIYDRFRAACDKFFNRKRDFYAKFKSEMTENMNKKLAIIEQAEAMQNSTDWKKTTQDFINLQKQWKEIGAVPRKKSEQLWNRFRAACDVFFNERDKNVKPENDYYGNLKAKKALIEEIKAYEASEDADTNTQAAKDFSDRWQSIGFVPYKEKDNIQKAYVEAMQAKFPDFQIRFTRSYGRGGDSRRPMTEKDRLVQQYNKLQQEIVNYENNIGFFSQSESSAPLIKQMQDKIAASKAELKELEAKIRKEEESEDQNQ